MIQITSDKTVLERDLESIEAPIKRIERRVVACVEELNMSLSALWSLPDERIEAILNSKGPQKVTELFTAHAETATMLNALLDSRGITITRAVIGLPREFTVDEQGMFHLAPLPGPPPPDPEPPVDP